MADSSLELARRVIDAFNRRDLDAFLALMDEEVELRPRFMEVEGDVPLRGHAGVRAWWDGILGVFPDFRIEIRSAREEGEAVVLGLRVHGHGGDSGAPVDENVWQAGRARGGRVTWWRNFATEREALIALDGTHEDAV
jgi:ketosteroid isomerase-like protein